jgi:hypothetical protein
MKGLGVAGVALGLLAAGDALAKVIARSDVADVSLRDLSASFDKVAGGAKDAGAFADLFAEGHGPFRREVESTSEAMDKFAESAQNAFGKNLSDKLQRLDFGQAGAKFDKQITQIDGALADMVRNGNADQAAEMYKRLMASIDAANKEGANIPVDEIAAKFAGYQEAIDGAKVSQDAMGSSSQGMSQNIEEVQQSTEDAKKAIDDYIGGLQDAGLVVLSSRQAQRDLKSAIADVSSQIKDNGKTLDENTEKGRNNADFLDGLAGKHLKAAEAIYKETGSEAQYRASLVKSRASLVETAQKFGMSRAAAERYADSVLKIPPTRKTTVTVVGIPAAAKAVDDLKLRLRGLDGKVVTTTIRVVERTAGQSGGSTHGGQVRGTGGPDPVHQATGGYIAGAGTATSDSIPAYLSNGEYVVKAAAVARYGKSFFDSVNAMRFATGGFVAGARRDAAPSVSTSTATNVFNAYGNDSETAMRKAMREWEFKQVSGL